jgi:hypothetical protein
VLAAMLAMSVGFRALSLLAVVLYLLALTSYFAIEKNSAR